jgi:hypothetical protein
MREIKNERESNAKFLRTRLVVMAAILTVGIAALASTMCRNPFAAQQVVPGAEASHILKHDGARISSSPRTAKGRDLARAAEAATDASVMWGSFAASGTCGERTCKSPVLPPLRVPV